MTLGAYVFIAAVAGFMLGVFITTLLHIASEN